MNFQNLAKHSTDYTVDDDESLINHKIDNSIENKNEKGL